ncbi:MAG: CvpA family protein [Acidobacteriota bacterium]|nr:CvpA family protein [Acidobacteriota bacterium]
MNLLDWLLIALLAYSVVRAFLQGFFREAFALVGLVLGLLLASWGYRDAAQRLAGLIASPQIAQFAAFLLILAVTMVIFSVAGRLLRKTASAIGLGMLDRAGGAVFGFIRGCLLGVAILMAFTAFLPTGQWTWIRDSKMAPYFLEGGHAVSFLVPQDLKHKLRDGTASLKHTTPNWIKPGP